MNDLLAVGAGLACAFAGWLLPRSGAGARWRSGTRVALDLFMPGVCFGFFVLLTARPFFAGALTWLLCIGYAYADRAKRAVLAEPIVYTDVFQTIDILRHPGLALPFPDKPPVVGGVAGAMILFVALFIYEPQCWAWTPWPAALLAIATTSMFWLLAGPLNPPFAAWLLTQGPTGDPLLDAAHFGPFGMLLAHGAIARSERASLRRSLATVAPAPSGVVDAALIPSPSANVNDAPLVIVQCESFFDARRLGPALLPGLLPNFECSCRSSLQWGRLSVPCWGANTVRTEFAVMTGGDPARLGFDRFNPYHRLARMPLASLASNLRQRGYKTICLHPFDRRFYRRDLVMPNLGFDRFIGQEAFVGSARVNGYVADIEVARLASAILREEGPKVFLFIITMENHGPWPEARAAGSVSRIAQGLTLSKPERLALSRYLSSLSNTDEMLGLLREALPREGTLALYGDHLPSFPGTFAKLGLRDHRTDYMIHRAGHDQAAARVDLAAHQLGAAILAAHFAEASPNTAVATAGLEARQSIRA